MSARSSETETAATNQLLREWKKAIKKAGFYPLFDCPFCHVNCGWFFERGELYYSCGCNCSPTPSKPRPSDDAHLLRYIESQESKIKEFVKNYPDDDVEVRYHITKHNLDGIVEKIKTIATFKSRSDHEDTFFESKNGLIKLREAVENNNTSNLLLYYDGEKTDSGPTSYATIGDPEGVKSCLKLAYGISGIVYKTRWHYSNDQGEIYVDHVEEMEGPGKMGYSINLSIKKGSDIVQQLGIPAENESKEMYLETIKRTANQN